MNKYIIKAGKSTEGDSFGFKEPKEFLFFFALGIKDLRNTIRCITPPGYRVKSPEWFSKMLQSKALKIMNPLLKTIMYEIRQINNSLPIERELIWNNRGFIHTLKIVSAENWKDIIDSNL